MKDMFAEKSTLCNGKLGNHYTLSIKPSLEVDDIFNVLTIKVRLQKDKTDTKILFNKKQAIMKLYMNGEVVDSISTDLDFFSKDQYMWIRKLNVSNTEIKKIDLKAELDVRDKSNYLTKTEIETSIMLRPIVETKLFVDLSCREQGDILVCKVKTNTEPDFLEFKVNQNLWRALEGDTFNVLKTGQNMYIQARGKQKSNYSYSNVIKILGNK